MKWYTIFFYVISYLKEVTINSFNFIYLLYIQTENWYLYLSYMCVCVYIYALVSFLNRASLVAQLVKNLPAMQETLVQFLVGKIPWRRKPQPTLVFWPGEFHGLYSPWGYKELDMTEWLSLHFTSSFIKHGTRLWICVVIMFLLSFYIKHS